MIKSVSELHGIVSPVLTPETIMMYVNGKWVISGGLAQFEIPAPDLAITVGINAMQFFKALKDCNDDKFTLVEKGSSVEIKWGRKRTTCAAVPTSVVPFVPSQQPAIVINDTLAAAISHIQKVRRESKNIDSTGDMVLLTDQRLYWTDRHTSAVVPHTCWLPNLWLSHKQLALLLRVKSRIVGAGGDAHSVSFVYENGATVRFNLMDSGMLPRLAEALTKFIEEHEAAELGDSIVFDVPHGTLDDVGYVIDNSSDASAHSSIHLTRRGVSERSEHGGASVEFETPLEALGETDVHMSAQYLWAALSIGCNHVNYLAKRSRLMFSSAETGIRVVCAIKK